MRSVQLVKHLTLHTVFFAICSFVLQVPVAHSFFDQAKEFPNLYLPEKIRQNPNSLEAQDLIDQRAELVESALKSVFERITIPIVPENGTTAVQTRYFDEVRRLAGDGVEIMPSGGVVRTTLSYLYDELKKGAEKIPPESSEAVLKRIVGDSRLLPGIEVRGVGSDWDLLIRSSDPEKKKEAIEKILRFTNSAEAKFSPNQLESGFKRTLFTIGDVKDYDEQIRRSILQGGSTLDFLAFDLKKGKIVEPPRYPDIERNLTGTFKDFIRGLFEYVAPLGKVDDGPKQTIRGMRPLLELPFLKLKDDTVFRRELEDLLASIQSGEIPSSKAIEQFSKMIRNARYAGANNRSYRGGPQSIDRLVYQVAEAIKKAANVTTIPEFLEPAVGVSRELPSDIPLMNVDEFLKNHTHGGKLYHGTPDPNNALAILRNSLFLSKPDQGYAYYGRGTYTDPNYEIAKLYAGDKGLVMELEVNARKDLRVLDWLKVKDLPKMKKIEEKAVAEGRDVFEYLAREYGIDVIIHQHVLLQNTSAVKFPKNFGALIRAYHRQLMDQKSWSWDSKVDALNNYSQLYEYAHTLGEKDIPPPFPRESLIREGIERLEREIPTDGTYLIGVRKMAAEFGDDPMAAQWIEGRLKHADSKVRFGTAFALRDSSKFDPALLASAAFDGVERALEANRYQYDPYRTNAMFSPFITHEKSRPLAIDFLKRIAKSDSPQKQVFAAGFLVGYDPDNQTKWMGLLRQVIRENKDEKVTVEALGDFAPQALKSDSSAQELLAMVKNEKWTTDQKRKVFYALGRFDAEQAHKTLPIGIALLVREPNGGGYTHGGLAGNIYEVLSRDGIPHDLDLAEKTLLQEIVATEESNTLANHLLSKIAAQRKGRASDQVIQWYEQAIQKRPRLLNDLARNYALDGVMDPKVESFVFRQALRGNEEVKMAALGHLRLKGEGEHARATAEILLSYLDSKDKDSQYYALRKIGHTQGDFPSSLLPKLRDLEATTADKEVKTAARQFQSDWQRHQKAICLGKLLDPAERIEREWQAKAAAKAAKKK